MASALVASTGFLRTSSGFVGTSDGWTDLDADRKLDWSYDSAPDGNVLQTGEIPVDAKRGRATTFTLALGFGESTAGAEQAARGSLRRSFRARGSALPERLARVPALARPRAARARAASSRRSTTCRS